MDITELRDGQVIELSADIEKPHSTRSKKPAPVWPTGTRFIVRQRSVDRRGGEDFYWTLTRGGTRDDRWQRHSDAEVNTLSDGDRFLRIVRNAKPVEDTFTLFGVVRYAHPLDVVDYLVRSGVLTLEGVRQGIEGYEAEEDAAEKVKEDARRAELVAADLATKAGP